MVTAAHLCGAGTVVWNVVASGGWGSRRAFTVAGGFVVGVAGVRRGDDQRRIQARTVLGRRGSV